jgi:hypothetical protein
MGPGAIAQAPGDMKPSEAQGSEAVIEGVLRALGVAPEDAIVYVRSHSERRRDFLIATPVGLLEATHRPEGPDGRSQPWRMDSRLISWERVVGLSVVVTTVQSDWEGLVSDVSLMLPGIDETFSGTTDPESDANGFISFVSECLRRRAAVVSAR